MPGTGSPGGVPNTGGLPSVRSFVSQFPKGETGNSSISLFADVGALIVAGFIAVASVSDNQQILPSTGSVVATGLAPSVVVNSAVAAGVGSVTVTGLASSVVVNTIALPSIGSGTLAGLSPSVSLSNNQNALSGSGAITAAGLAPSVAVNFNASADTGQLSVAGLAPAVATTQLVFLTPDVGLFSVGGFSPDVQGDPVSNQGGYDYFLNRGKWVKRRLAEYEPTVTVAAVSLTSVGVPAPLIQTPPSPVVKGTATQAAAVAPVVSVGSIEGDEREVTRASQSQSSLRGGRWTDGQSSSDLNSPQIPVLPAQATETAPITAVAPSTPPNPTAPQTASYAVVCETGLVTLAGYAPSVNVSHNRLRPPALPKDVPWSIEAEDENDDTVAIIAAIYAMVA